MTRTAAIFVTFAVALGGCSPPNPVVTAGDLVIQQATELQRQAGDFVTHANAVRKRAEARLDAAAREVGESQAALNDAERRYAILENKTAQRILATIRADDTALAADPYGYLSITASLKADQVRFGTIKADTKDLKTVIENIDAVRKGRTPIEALTFAFKTAQKVNESLAERKAEIDKPAK